MLCHDLANRTEQSRIKINNTGMARRQHRSTFLLPSCLGRHTTWQCCALAVRSTFLRNSITLWNEQPVLVGRMGFRVRAIHCSGNVSHFHEYWMECATVGRLSLSLWFVFLPPHPTPTPTHSSSIWTVTFSPAPAARSLKQISVFYPCLCGWEPSLVRHRKWMMSDYANNMHHQHTILTETLASIGSKTSSKHGSLTWTLIDVYAQPEFAQTLYWEALNPVCQKWCQCSHGNYSYTLPHALPQLE